MIDVYYYLPSEQVDNALACGLKLSEWFDREVEIQGTEKRCISALLNPRDDMHRYNSEAYKCLRMELNPKYCFIADRYLYQAAVYSSVVREMYMRSIKPVGEYIFGTYRLPECLVTSTVLAEQISLMDKRRDAPVLYESSEKLYISNMIESYNEEYDDFSDVLMYYFYNKLAEIGKVDKIEDSDKKIALFIDKTTERIFTSKIPDLMEY